MSGRYLCLPPLPFQQLPQITQYNTAVLSCFVISTIDPSSNKSPNPHHDNPNPANLMGCSSSSNTLPPMPTPPTPITRTMRIPHLRIPRNAVDVVTFKVWLLSSL